MGDVFLYPTMASSSLKMEYAVVSKTLSQWFARDTNG